MAHLEIINQGGRTNREHNPKMSVVAPRRHSRLRFPPALPATSATVDKKQYEAKQRMRSCVSPCSWPGLRYQQHMSKLPCLKILVFACRLNFAFLQCFAWCVVPLRVCRVTRCCVFVLLLCVDTRMSACFGVLHMCMFASSLFRIVRV